jgi:hypothetical protein
MSENYDAVARIIESESRQAEENKRFNAERAIVLRLAPDKWREIREAVKRDCNAITRVSHRVAFRCDEPDANTLEISRLDQGAWFVVATITYCEEFPAVFFDCQRTGVLVRDILRFVLRDGSISIVSGNRGVVLPHFLGQLLVDIAR